MPQEQQHPDDQQNAPFILTPDRFSSEKRRQLSDAALRTFINIAKVWGLSEQQKLMVLGSPARSTFHLWLTKVEQGRPIKLSVDTLLRISAVLGIYKALRIIFEDEEEAVRWLNSQNRAPCFGNHPPMTLITGGTQDGLLLVRRYLDAFRGGRFAGPTDAEFEQESWNADDLVIIE